MQEQTNKGRIKSLVQRLFSATSLREKSFILLRLSLVFGKLPCMLVIIYSIGDFVSLMISANFKKKVHNSYIKFEYNDIVHKSLKVDIIFNPHILPIERGIISSIYCNLEDNIKISHIEDCLINFYKNHKFIEIKNNKNETSLFEVIGTNKCIIKVVKNVINNTVVIQSFIDNIIKGASGQAVQNMNIMMGYNEDQALTLNPLVLR